jgi:hypothetical protein
MPTKTELRQAIRDLKKEIAELEPKLTPLGEASETANLTAADTLCEWHNGNLTTDALAYVQEKAAFAAQELGTTVRQLAEARKALSSSQKALEELQQ